MRHTEIISGPNASSKNVLKQAQRQYEQEEFIRLKVTAELDLKLFYRSLKRRNKKSWTSNELRVDGRFVRDPDTHSARTSITKD